MRGVFLDSKTLDQQDLDFSILTSTLPHWDLYDLTKPAEVASRIHQADIVVTNKVVLTAEHLSDAKTLRCICLASTGCDQVDVGMAKSLGIRVCNVAGYSTSSVIQHTIGLLIHISSRIGEYDRLVKQGAWEKSPLFCLQNYKTMELEGKLLGIVGFGAIGQGVAKVAASLGMQVIVAQRQGVLHPWQLPLSELLSLVDVLSLHCPLTENTRGLIGEKEIQAMKKGAILLNVSRGGLIDEQALAQALLNGHLAGAGLDVCSHEPPHQDFPLLAQDHPNLVMTPHVAWSTYDSRKRLLIAIANNVQSFLAATPKNVVC